MSTTSQCDSRVRESRVINQLASERNRQSSASTAAHTQALHLTTKQPILCWACFGVVTLSHSVSHRDQVLEACIARNVHIMHFSARGQKQDAMHRLFCDRLSTHAPFGDG